MPISSSIFEIIPGSFKGLFLTCEHSSNRLPEGSSWERDGWISNLHWAYDIGALEVTKDLARELKCMAVFSKLSRLYVDMNRHTEESILVKAEGRPIFLNVNISPKERSRRWSCNDKYHDAVRTLIAKCPKDCIVWHIHSFTPVFEGSKRDLEIGVLFERVNTKYASEIHDHLRKNGFDARLNEPYDVIDLITRCTADVGDREHLYLETRNDLACDPVFRKRFVTCLTNWVHQKSKL